MPGSLLQSSWTTWTNSSHRKICEVFSLSTQSSSSTELREPFRRSISRFSPSSPRIFWITKQRNEDIFNLIPFHCWTLQGARSGYVSAFREARKAQYRVWIVWLRLSQGPPSISTRYLTNVSRPLGPKYGFSPMNRRPAKVTDWISNDVGNPLRKTIARYL